ncbi:hypothetical protein ACOMHN_023484 [Nucella lapillus]
MNLGSGYLPTTCQGALILQEARELSPLAEGLRKACSCGSTDPVTGRVASSPCRDSWPPPVANTNCGPALAATPCGRTETHGLYGSRGSHRTCGSSLPAHTSRCSPNACGLGVPGSFPPVMEDRECSGRLPPSPYLPHRFLPPHSCPHHHHRPPPYPRTTTTTIFDFFWEQAHAKVGVGGCGGPGCGWRPRQQQESMPVWREGAGQGCEESPPMPPSSSGPVQFLGCYRVYLAKEGGAVGGEEKGTQRLKDGPAGGTADPTPHGSLEDPAAGTLTANNKRPGYVHH